MVEFTFTENYDAPLAECGVRGCRGRVAYKKDRTYSLDRDYAQGLEDEGRGYIRDAD